MFFEKGIYALFGDLDDRDGSDFSSGLLVDTEELGDPLLGSTEELGIADGRFA